MAIPMKRKQPRNIFHGKPYSPKRRIKRNGLSVDFTTEMLRTIPVM